MTAPVSPAVSPPLGTAHRLVAGVLAGSIVVMAFLAGRATFVSPDLIDIHGYLGNAIFLLVLANVALAVATRRPRAEIGLAVAIAVLTFAQIGMGYVGRDAAIESSSAEAAAIHIPNGVLLMGLSMWQYAVIRLRPQ